MVRIGAKCRSRSMGRPKGPRSSASSLRLTTPDGNATWLLTKLKSEDLLTGVRPHAFFHRRHVQLDHLRHWLLVTAGQVPGEWNTGFLGSSEHDAIAVPHLLTVEDAAKWIVHVHVGAGLVGGPDQIPRISRWYAPTGGDTTLRGI